MEKLQAGTLLIAEPFLKDFNFARSVVFLCDYKDEGAFGFVINRKSEYVIGDLLRGLEDCDYPVFYGGPVQPDTIHFIHRCPGLITCSEKITDDIYWGKEYDEMITLLKYKKISTHDIRIFLGYSGWSENQLENEVREKSWLTTYGTPKIVFNDEKLIWAEALKQLGGIYEQLIHYPKDPQLN